MSVAGGLEQLLGRTSAPTSAPAAAVAAPLRPHLGYNAAKRAVDVVLGLFCLILALPVLIVAASAIFVTTRRNPLLRQRRVGFHGDTFSMLKLRTMRQATPASPIVSFRAKSPHDPRITAIGAFLRRTSIDELPQLVNVIAGQMSLVGPRPVLPAEAATFPVSWRRRFEVKPGLTGLWQVSGRSTVPVERWMALDRLYVWRRSLFLDARILVRTIGAVLTMRGAW
jgi:lipopolysaccharide/colanic/teichoic acid biosynthesis glycosyltransferase